MSECVGFKAAEDDFAEWPEENRRAAKRSIIEELENYYQGGFKVWCQERKLNEEEIRKGAE